MGDKGETPASSPFAPQAALARTPPSGYAPPLPSRLAAEDMELTPSAPVRPPRQRSTPRQPSPPPPPPPAAAGASKRQLTSPEERRPTDVVRLCRPVQAPAPSTASVSAPPTAEAAAPEHDEDNSSLARATKVELLDRVHNDLSGIMDHVTSSSSRLNKDSINAISTSVRDTLAVVAALSLRLCEMEAELGRATMRNAIMEKELLMAKTAGPRSNAPASAGVATAPTYSAMLRMSKTADLVPIAAPRGPVLAFYPAQDQLEVLKTAEDTKAELKRAVDPRALDVQVDKVRKVGNAGVVVQTTSPSAAERLKKAAPPSLRVSEPKRFSPRICFRNVDGNPSVEEVLLALQEQNLRGTEWSIERLRAQTKVFKMNGRQGQSTVVLECSPALREVLLEKGRIYIGWQAVEACDFVRVTCCNKCQTFGHPEKYCRSQDLICGRCGAAGHKKDDCKAEKSRCATCHRFGRESESHATNARTCPARLYAEQRAVSSTNYGCP